MRWIAGLAGAAAIAMAGGAQAATIMFDITVASNAWFQVAGSGSPYGLAAQPTITGSITLDDTKTGADAITDLLLTSGAHSWTKADIDAGGTSFDFLGGGFVGGWTLAFDPDPVHDYIISGGTAQIRDGINAIACNSCVSSTQGIPPQVPEPATWLLLMLGAGLTGWRLRRRLAAAVSGTS